jgi:glutamate-1-semialdehyde 2,1-aminomutase
MKRRARSAQLFEQSRRFLAGGVSSTLRASSKPLPLFFRSASGSKLTDADGNRYLDYTLAWGPTILGHSYPALLKAVRKQLGRFQLLGAQHELEICVARKIGGMVPCAELVAFSNTGSEAVQLALRLARAFTGRQKIIKFEGHYHGWPDNILVSYHPKPPTDGSYGPQLTSEGQQRCILKDVVVLPWNDLEQVERCFEQHPDEIAAIITEPILCNSSCLMPRLGYLEGLRGLARRYGAVLILDEVITGFRVAAGGAQELFGVVPDLATFGKAVAGGFPLSVVAGRRDIMGLIAQGRVVHAGTFNGNPISLAAAEVTLDVLSGRRGAVLARIRRNGEVLIDGIRRLAENAKIPILVNGVGSAFHLSFTCCEEMQNYRDSLDCDMQARDRFIEAMLEAGVYLLPDGRWYVSAAHSEADIGLTLGAVCKSFAKLKEIGPLAGEER